MKETKYWNLCDKSEKEQENIMKQAAHLLKSGELIAFPTETVYGLGADATNECAVAKIFKAKGRPQDNPLIVHVAKESQFVPLVQELSPLAKQLIHKFSPGPITYILNSRGICAKNVTAGLPTIAVRIPDHPVALQLLKTSNLPLAAPSANLSGKPSPTTAKHVLADMQGKIAGIIDGGATKVGMESTVIDLTQERPTILRPGAITKEMLEAELNTQVDLATERADDQKPLSPGLKYPHYAPDVPLILGSSSPGTLQQLIKTYERKGKRVGILAREQLLTKINAANKVSLGKTLEDVGKNLYDCLRAFKVEEVDLIICETFPEKGLGQAVMNRLKKAATHPNINDPI